MPPPPPSRRLALSGFSAAAVHGLLDAVLSRLPWARPPYLRTEDLPEPFRDLPLVSAPLAVSVAVSIAGGFLAVISLAAVDAVGPRRFRLVAGLVTGFWTFTAALTWLTWLSTPFLRALPGIALGVPRGLLVAWMLVRLSPTGRRPA